MQREMTGFGGKRVLVADDEELIRNVTRQILIRHGFEVQLACDGQEAVQMFQANPQAFGAVLLDMTMPVMDGEEAFHEIRQIRSDIPVLLCSGYSEHETCDRFSDHDLTGFLQKPFRMNTLLENIKQAMAAGEASFDGQLVHAKAG